jgi:hypothetical protein
MDSIETATETAVDEAKRERSKIGFVYSDLEAAVSLVTTLNSRAGTSSCTPNQLAGWMNQSPVGGSFRSSVGAAKTFGLIETGPGKITITDLGLRALDPSRRAAALAEAFLRVPLHAAMVKQYETHVLPPAAALERQMEALGVPTKQKERARQTFFKSAIQAGFIDTANGRLIKPAVSAPPPDSANHDKKRKPLGGSGGGDDGGLHLDGLLMELLRKIPATEQGWPKEQRLRWFRTFAMNVSQIYDTENEVVDLTIKLGSGEQQ